MEMLITYALVQGTWWMDKNKREKNKFTSSKEKNIHYKSNVKIKCLNLNKT